MVGLGAVTRDQHEHLVDLLGAQEGEGSKALQYPHYWKAEGLVTGGLQEERGLLRRAQPAVRLDPTADPLQHL